MYLKNKDYVDYQKGIEALNEMFGDEFVQGDYFTFWEKLGNSQEERSNNLWLM